MLSRLLLQVAARPPAPVVACPARCLIVAALQRSGEQDSLVLVRGEAGAAQASEL